MAGSRRWRKGESEAGGGNARPRLRRFNRNRFGSAGQRISHHESARFHRDGRDSKDSCAADNSAHAGRGSKAVNSLSRARMKAQVLKRIAGSTCVLSVLLVAGCTVGPNYKRPAAPVPPVYMAVGDWKPAQPNDHNLAGN